MQRHLPPTPRQVTKRVDGVVGAQDLQQAVKHMREQAGDDELEYFTLSNNRGLRIQTPQMKWG